MERQRARISDCRKRAEGLRTLAENMTDPDARRGMLNAAASYDALADDAEGRATTEFATRRAARPI